MAKAGFWAISNSEIRFGRDGIWYADDEPIRNRRIADLFARSLRREEGKWVLVSAQERAEVVVDDTPWVVRRCDREGDAWFATVNDGSRERLRVASLRVDDEGVFYLNSEQKGVELRFVRAACHQISEAIEEGADGIAIEIEGERRVLA